MTETHDCCRELFVGLTRLGDSLSEVVGILKESGLFDNPSALDRVSNILATGIFAGIFTSKFGAPVAVPTALGASAVEIYLQAKDHFLNDRAATKNLLEQLSTDEYFVDQLGRLAVEAYFELGQISEEDFRQIHARDWTLLDETVLRSLIDTAIEQSGITNPEELTPELILQHGNLAQYAPELWSIAQQDEAFMGLLNAQIEVALVTPSTLELLENVVNSFDFTDEEPTEEEINALFNQAIESGTFDLYIKDWLSEVDELEDSSEMVEKVKEALITDEAVFYDDGLLGMWIEMGEDSEIRKMIYELIDQTINETLLTSDDGASDGDEAQDLPDNDSLDDGDAQQDTQGCEMLEGRTLCDVSQIVDIHNTTLFELNNQLGVQSSQIEMIKFDLTSLNNDVLALNNTANYHFNDHISIVLNGLLYDNDAIARLADAVQQSLDGTGYASG